MILERSMSDGWLSNTYLVASGPGSDAFFVDAGGPVEPLIAKADEHDLNVTHVLLTHHHGDHVSDLGQLKERWPDAEVLIHPEEREAVMGVTGDLLPDQELEIGGLSVKALHTPGHTGGMLSLLVGGTDVFTGDTLFKGSVGGVRAPGSTGYDDLKHSIMEVLLALPPETTIRPGHTDPTTVGEELESNGFVRIWRGARRRGRPRGPGAGREGDARAARRRLRRRAQGVGALARRPGRHRARLEGLASVGGDEPREVRRHIGHHAPHRQCVRSSGRDRRPADLGRRRRGGRRHHPSHRHSRLREPQAPGHQGPGGRRLAQDALRHRGAAARGPRLRPARPRGGADRGRPRAHRRPVRLREPEERRFFTKKKVAIALATGAVAFVIAAVVVTAGELTFSSDSKPSQTTFFGGKGARRRRRRRRRPRRRRARRRSADADPVRDRDAVGDAERDQADAPAARPPPRRRRRTAPTPPAEATPSADACTSPPAWRRTGSRPHASHARLG